MKAKEYWVLLIAVLAFSMIWDNTLRGVSSDGSNEVRNRANVSSVEKALEQYAHVRRSTLRGLEGVALSVLDDTFEQYGLTETHIRTDTELALRRLGIKVLSEAQTCQLREYPVLSVVASVIKIPDEDLFISYVVVELSEKVVLARDPNVSSTAVTWRTWGQHGLLSPTDLPTVRQTVKADVDQFVKDYLAANQKEPAKDEQDNK
ncbi:MAG: hypothetical protein JSV99_01740 [Planctomycetota bacterium]|nr:MAG: hypothetical protein JSV99_01740 [Planctomycetota bacterium]